MKKILFFLLLAILIFGGVSYAQEFINFDKFLSRSACDKPLEYKIGSIDPRFNLTEDKLISQVGEAEKIWEEASDRDLFAYSSTAPLTINMVYDRRQSLHREINQLEGQLESQKGDLEARRADFQRVAYDFEKRLDQFNSEVKSWNSQGGAPQEEYEALIRRQEELKADADKLNKLASELNLETRQYNTQVGQLNQTVSAFNENLRRKPEEGLYDPAANTIEIYFVVSEKELTHTIAHEFGHALGLAHIDNAHSIMFPFSTEVVDLSSDDVGAVGVLCREVGLPEIMREIFTTRVRGVF